MGCTGCSGWISRKSRMASDAVECAGVNTPLVTYCDGPDARAAREGSTTCTSAQAETPVTIITKQIRQPIGIRIKASLRAFSLQLCTAKCGEGKPRRHSFFRIYQK